MRASYALRFEQRANIETSAARRRLFPAAFGKRELRRGLRGQGPPCATGFVSRSGRGAIAPLAPSPPCATTCAMERRRAADEVEDEGEKTARSREDDVRETRGEKAREERKVIRGTRIAFWRRYGPTFT